MTTELSVDEINLSTPEFWVLPWSAREAAFRTLRRERPVAFFEEPDVPGLPKGPGYYAITRHADILEISRQPDLFCSAQGATSITDLPAEMIEFYGSMINMDDPRHQRLRGIVSRRFTPRDGAARDGRRAARRRSRVIDDVIGKGAIDFVTEVAHRLPLNIICDLMGIPESQYELVLDKSNIILSSGDPEYIPEGSDLIQAFMTAGAELASLMRDLAPTSAQHPADDLTSALVTAELDGERLTDDELASFFILLAVAGNETTRNAISHGLVALAASTPSSARIWMQRLRDRRADRGRGDRALGDAGHLHAPHRHPRRRAVGGHQFHDGDKSHPLLQLGQPRRARLRRPVSLRRPPRPELPRRLRRPRSALLPRRAPGAARDHGDVPRALPPPARHPHRGRARRSCARRSSTASSTCR